MSGPVWTGEGTGEWTGCDCCRWMYLSLCLSFVSFVLSAQRHRHSKERPTKHTTAQIAPPEHARGMGVGRCHVICLCVAVVAVVAVVNLLPPVSRQTGRQANSSHSPAVSIYPTIDQAFLFFICLCGCVFVCVMHGRHGIARHLVFTVLMV